MVSVKEMSPTGIAAPVIDQGEQPKWMLRKAPQERLLAINAQIITPGFDPDAMLFNNSSVVYDARVDRSIFFSAQMPYQLIDVLRGVKIFDFNKEEEGNPMDLVVKRTPTSLHISSDWENASIFLHMSGQNQFAVQLRPLDSTKPYRNQELADAAKDVLRQSKGKYKVHEGKPYEREYDSYWREYGEYDGEGNKIVKKYDIYDPNNIAADEHIAITVLNALQIMAESGNLRYRSSSDNRFRRQYPNSPLPVTPLEERQLGFDLGDA